MKQTCKKDVLHDTKNALLEPINLFMIYCFYIRLVFFVAYVIATATFVSISLKMVVEAYQWRQSMNSRDSIMVLVVFVHRLVVHVCTYRL
jgi:ABC-type proline/glycine betaine transport system permease subunit